MRPDLSGIRRISHTYKKKWRDTGIWRHLSC